MISGTYLYPPKFIAHLEIQLYLGFILPDNGGGLGGLAAKSCPTLATMLPDNTNGNYVFHDQSI